MPSKGSRSSPDPPSTPDTADISWAASCLRNFGNGDKEVGDNDDPISIYLADYLDSIPQPAETLGTFLPPKFEPQPEETEISGVSPFSNPLVPGAAEFLTWEDEEDENPSSAMAAAGEAEDEDDIFPVWDLNTGNAELETDILKELWALSLEGNASSDSRELFSSTPPAVDALNLKDLDSALEECQDVDSLIADMAGLNISVSGKHRDR